MLRIADTLSIPLQLAGRSPPNTASWSARAHASSLSKVFCFALVTCAIANAFHIFAFPLTIDSEVYAFVDNPNDFLPNERWTAALLAWLLVPRSSIPVVPDLLAITASAAAYTLTAVNWRREIGFEHYIAAPLATTFPILFEVMLFPSYSYGVFIGLLLASIGVWLLSRDTAMSNITALGCLCLAVGVYQPIAMYPVVTHTVAVALDVDRRGIPAALRRLIFGAAVIVIAVLLSHLIGSTISRWNGYASDYINGYFRFDLLAQAPISVLKTTLILGRSILLGNADVFIEECKPFVVFLTVISVWGLVAAAMAPNKVRAAVSTFLVVGSVAGAIGVAVIDGGLLPMRTLLGLPIALAGLAFAAAGDRNRSPRWSAAARWSLVVGSVWCFVAFATIGSRLYYSAYVTWLNDRALGEEILARIDALPGLDSSRPIPIELSGFHDWPRSQMVPAVGSNPAGASFFGWDEGNTGRVVYFMKTLGRLDFEAASAEQHINISAAVEKMPAWPRPGAISMIDGTVVIKFGPYSESQK